MKRRGFLALLPLALAGGCGFQLRRQNAVPFATLYLDAPAGGAVAQRVRNTLAADRRARLVARREEADAVLVLGQEIQSKTILSLSGAGRVTEYRLGLKLQYSVQDKRGATLAAEETLELVRDMTYDDTQMLAKGAEEALLYRDMVDAAALRIVRRLQALQPAKGS